VCFLSQLIVRIPPMIGGATLQWGWRLGDYPALWMLGWFRRAIGSSVRQLQPETIW